MNIYKDFIDTMECVDGERDVKWENIYDDGNNQENFLTA